ncbi:MAG: hypothetical protein P8188_15435 [Gemmatimonadota bacterium]
MSRSYGGRPAALCLMILLGSCTLGRGDQPRYHAPPSGIRLHLEFEAEAMSRLTGLGATAGGSLRGEAVSMQPDGLLFRVELATSGMTGVDRNRLLLLDESALRLADIREQGDEPSARGRSLDASKQEDLEFIGRWARYPEPLSRERMEALVAGLGEPTMVRAGPGRESGSGAAAAPESREAFLARARAAGARFRDRRVAIREGYRRLGPDFPGMGEHWVHPGRVVSGKVVAEEPPVLSYVAVGGEPVLTGVAWTVPLFPGERPPPNPLGDRVWHDHSGTLDEEALLLDSPRTHQHASAAHQGPVGLPEGGSGEGRPRLSMVHAWLWAPNPDGLLAQNNWTLPYLKAGLRPPEAVDAGVARALSLGGSGAEYYQTLLVRAAGAGERDREIITRRVREASLRVDQVVDRRTGADPDRALDPPRLQQDDQARLEAEWARLWAALEAELSREAWRQLGPAAETWRSGA